MALDDLENFTVEPRELFSLCDDILAKLSDWKTNCFLQSLKFSKKQQTRIVCYDIVQTNPQITALL